MRCKESDAHVGDCRGALARYILLHFPNGLRSFPIAEEYVNGPERCVLLLLLGRAVRSLQYVTAAYVLLGLVC